VTATVDPVTAPDAGAYVPPKRGDRAAPPVGGGEWELVFATSEVAKGWEGLRQYAAANTAAACHELQARGPIA
jgi:hypothetical protein